VTTTWRRTLAATAAVVAVAVLGWSLWPHRPGPTTLYAGTARYTATVTVANPRPGTTAVTITLATRTGAPVGNAAILVQATQPLMGLATPAIPTTSTGTGRYTTPAVPLMTTGPWQLHLTITGPTGTPDNLQLPLTVTG
jgi:hypothetical protein